MFEGIAELIMRIVGISCLRDVFDLGNMTVWGTFCLRELLGY